MTKKEDEARFVIAVKKDEAGSAVVAKEEDEARLVVVAKEERRHGTRERVVRWTRYCKERNEPPRNRHLPNSEGHVEPKDKKGREGRDERDDGDAHNCPTTWVRDVHQTR